MSIGSCVQRPARVTQSAGVGKSREARRDPRGRADRGEPSGVRLLDRDLFAYAVEPDPISFWDCPESGVSGARVFISRECPRG